MTREILFKAKRIENGEWVEGYYVKSAEGHYIVVPNKEESIWGEGKIIEIDHNTLCQYTGLCDKNGNKIWENDVCNCQERGCGFFGCVVKWNRVMARFDVNAIGCDFAMTLEECVDDISINGLDYEVIGNIFDNPELLGGGE